MKDHYNQFLAHISTQGIEWVYYFKNSKPKSINVQVLSTDDNGKSIKNDEPQIINKMQQLFPELGPFFIAHNVEKNYEEAIKENKDDELSLRSFLKSCYVLYLTDSVSVKIYNQNKDLITTIKDKKIKDIKLFHEEVESLKKYDCIFVNLVLHLNPSNTERIFHEQKSLIQDSDMFLTQLLKKNKLLQIIERMKKDNPSLLNDRMNLLNNDINNFYNLDSFLSYKNVETYVRFLEFFERSKYSNDYLKDLGTKFIFDFNISQKHQYRLQYKYI